MKTDQKTRNTEATDLTAPVPSPWHRGLTTEQELSQERTLLTLWLSDVEDPTDPLEAALMPLMLSEVTSGSPVFKAPSDRLTVSFPRSLEAVKLRRAAITGGDRWVRAGRFTWLLTDEGLADYTSWRDYFLQTELERHLRAGGTEESWNGLELPSPQESPRVVEQGRNAAGNRIKAPIEPLVGILGATEIDSLRYSGLDAAQRAHLAGVARVEEVLLFNSCLPVETDRIHLLLREIAKAYDPAAGIAELDIETLQKDLGSTRSTFYAHLASVRAQGLWNLRVLKGSLTAGLSRIGAAEMEAFLDSALD